MQLFDKLKNSPDALPITDSSKKKLVIGLCGILAIAMLILFARILLSNKEEQTPAYEYNAVEQQIADEVKAFLALYIELPEAISAQIADAAVQDYNIIMSSDIDVVNDDHTDAIKQRIRASMLTLIENSQTLTDEELNGLASGIAEIIWNAILGQIEAVSATSDVQEYIYLAESIQEQINELSEQKQKMKISIQADIPSQTISTTDLDAESLLAAIDGMTDSELQELAKALGISLDELQNLINANNTDFNKLLEERLTALEKKITTELQKNNGTSTASTAKDGKDGKNGTNGKNGTDGKDGKNTYIAYADDTRGTGFSLTPTETSRYVGTCITSSDTQPKDYTSYSNWQIYRTYIITTTVDENNVTTLHIN